MKRTRHEIQETLEPVRDGLERMRRVLTRQLADPSAAVGDMTAHVTRFRGKQLRAALVLLVGEATGNTTDEHATVAAIVEMIHLATLVHDDILDGAETRRKVASVHQRWDNQTAVLLGDFLYARAFGLSTELSSRLCSQLLSEATRRICAGEIEQANKRFDFELSQADYEAIAGAKTAILYGAACELGARYPGGNVAVGAAMRSVGEALGLAFQIIDDCLDLTGDPEQTGKGVGTDVADGKVTLPVLHAFALADDATRAVIRDCYTRPDLVDRLTPLKALPELERGLAFARRRAEELIGDASARIGALPHSRAREAIEQLLGFVVERSF
ncbi:MAG: polyprenyl synthetase family protein [Planctomycetota bacterium]